MWLTLSEVAGTLGRGWRFGETLVESDPSDIFASGYAITDVWGPDAATLDADG